MPRLTNKEYLLRRRFLQNLLEHKQTQKVLSVLEPNKQSVLHSYFATSKHNWSDMEALSYRKTRSNSEAFSAGKAFNELIQITSGTKAKTLPRVTVTVRPEIDARLYAQALVAVAKSIRQSSQ